MNEIHIPQFWKTNWVKIKVMVAGYLKTPDSCLLRGLCKCLGEHKRVGTNCELCVPKKYVNNSEKDSRKPRDIFDMSKFPKSAQEFRDELPHIKNPALIRAAKEARERIRKLQGKV